MKFYNEMDRVGPKQRQKLLKMRPKRQTLRKLHEYLICRKLLCCQVRGLLSIAGYVFERNHLCDRLLVTTLKTPQCKAGSDGIIGPAREIV